jgi:hypothetical protein
MQPNPYLRKLGFNETDRVVIIHADDLGVSQASLSAFEELIHFGLVTSGAVMAPCSWFPAVAAYCRANPDVDMGVHLTLNSEWDTYRWAPISTSDPASGLLDDEGFFPRTPKQVQANTSSEVVYNELVAQVERCLAAGIDLTHIDTHMGTVMDTQIAPRYIQTAYQFRLPLLAPRLGEAELRARGISHGLTQQYSFIIQQLESIGMPLHDGVYGIPLEQPNQRLAQVKRVIDELPAGLSRIYIHPAIDTPETRAISPDWPARVQDYLVFLNEELRDVIRDSGIQLIGYRILRDELRRVIG